MWDKFGDSKIFLLFSYFLFSLIYTFLFICQEHVQLIKNKKKYVAKDFDFKCCSFEFSAKNHEKIMKYAHNATTVFSIYENNKCFLSSKAAY